MIDVLLEKIMQVKKPCWCVHRYRSATSLGFTLDLLLIGYLARGIKVLGWNMNYELAIALSIPIVAGLAAFGIRHVRQTVTRTAK
ncbi:MAG: DUF3422 family protein [Steroidobacteraceae bacterium]